MTITDGELRELFIKDARHIERLGWKQQDPEEFAAFMTQFLAGLAGCTIRISKPQLLRVMQKAKLSLSASEIRLFTEKVCTCWSYVKTKLRDSGSGRYMSSPVKRIGKIWEKKFGKIAKVKHGKATVKKDEDSTERKNNTHGPCKFSFVLDPCWEALKNSGTSKKNTLSQIPKIQEQHSFWVKICTLPTS